MTTTLRGKVSWFGGPDDTGVAPDEPLAFIYDVSDQPSLFLDEQPPGTTGLARRLDPEVFYLAMRWDYDETPREMLLEEKALVRSVKSGIAMTARPADWGPGIEDRIADLSPGLMDAIGIETDDEVEIIFPYQGVRPMSDIPVCIDISHWQGFPDFEEVAGSGVKGMIHKATEGCSYIDPNRATNCANAVNAGLAIATYFWIKPGDGKAQAEFYLATIDPVRGERVVIDYEEDGCSLTTLEDAVAALLDYNLDLKVTVYSGHLIKQQLSGRNDFLAEHTDLWLAQYTSDESAISWETATWPRWSLWQYSETGVIPGIDDAYVDLNNFDGSDDEFLTWISPAGEKPPKPKPPPQPDDQRVVDVAITAPEDVRIRISVNERPILRPERGGLLRALRAVRRGPDIVR